MSIPKLETERLVLREVTREDAEDIFVYLSDQEVMKYFGMEPFQTIEDAYREIDWYQEKMRYKTGIRWGITLKETNRVIGSCGFLNWSSAHYRADIGAELDKQYWSNGIVSEAFQAVLKYGFEEMDLMRVQALIEPPNIASQRLAEKNGFLREGLLRKYEFTCGKFDDLYMYSILKEDYLK